MKWKFAGILAFGVLFSLACQPATNYNNSAPANTNTNASATKTEAVKESPTDMQQLAQRIVNQSAGVKEGEVVHRQWFCPGHRIVENIMMRIEKIGGQALLTMNSEKLTKSGYTDVPKNTTHRNQSWAWLWPGSQT